MKPGARVRVNNRIVPGFGEPPPEGALGRVDRVLETGAVLVVLDDGRRALLASWEIDEVPEAQA